MRNCWKQKETKPVTHCFIYFWKGVLASKKYIQDNTRHVTKDIVCPQTECAFLSYCFIDRTFARESAYFVQKQVSRAPNHRQMRYIKKSIRIWIIPCLCTGTVSFTWITEVENRNPHDLWEQTSLISTCEGLSSKELSLASRLHLKNSQPSDLYRLQQTIAQTLL